MPRKAANEDDLLLAEQLGRLQEENDELKDKLKDAKLKIKEHEWHEWKESAFRWGVTLVLVTSLCLPLVIILLKVIFSPGTATHCIVQYETETYISKEILSTKEKMFLIGIVPWGDNQNYGPVSSIEDAVVKAKALRCPLTLPNTTQNK